LNATTLHLKHEWLVPAAQRVNDSDFGATPALYTPPGSPALVSAPNQSGYLYTWYESNLTRLWEKPLTTVPWITTLTESSGRLFGATPATAVNGTAFPSTLFSLHARTGSVQWQIGLAGNLSKSYGAPTWVNGVLVVNDGTYLDLVEGSDGKVLSKSVPGGGMIPPVSVWGDEILVGHGDNVTAYAVVPGAGAGPSLGAGTTDPIAARPRD
jgi:outer membrane protein assembly factor BamB